MTTSTKPRRTRRFARKSVTSASVIVPAVPDSTQTDPQAPIAPVRSESKTARVLALLQRPDGATLDELVAETSWLPHTIRAAMTGLRKKGHEVQRTTINGVSRYTITAAA